MRDRSDNDGLSPSFKKSSLALGFLIGTLIHFSSLGGSYLTTFNSKQNDTSNSNLVWFSLLWSLLTSSLGVLLLTTVRSLLNVEEKSIIKMEFLFGAGALGGVSVSWLIIDTVLGGEGQLQASVLTIMFTALWFRILATMMRFATHDDDQSEEPNAGSDLVVPLLVAETKMEQEEYTKESLNAPTCTLRFRCLSLLCGCLVGLFIQFGSLGANFVMQQVVRSNASMLLYYSLGWSFVCSSVGIGALLIVRNMLEVAWPDQTFTFLLVTECFFAIGATLGLNAAWTMTDLILGFQTHASENLLALIATMIWCKLVLCCTSGWETNDEDERDGYDGDDEVSTA